MSQPGKFVDTLDTCVVELLPDSSEYTRIGYVNVGPYSVELRLCGNGHLAIEVDPRGNKGVKPLATLTVRKEAAVEAGGSDPDDE